MRLRTEPLLLIIFSSFSRPRWVAGERERVCVFADSMTNVKKMEPLIDDRINHWISKVDELFAKTHEKMDFAPWAVYVAYDIISEVGFGTSCEWCALVAPVFDTYMCFTLDTDKMNFFFFFFGT